MFVKKSSIDEIVESLEENIKIAHSYEENVLSDNRKSVIGYLAFASEILDEIGLEKEASNVSVVLKKVAESDFKSDSQSDPHIPHSSQQALHNLEHKGWMFNADDDEVDIGDTNDAKDEKDEKERCTNKRCVLNPFHTSKCTQWPCKKCDKDEGEHEAGCHLREK